MTARVLVVDDVAPNVKLLEAKLTSEYFDVLCATSGAEALDIIQREHPDIVLLDVMMPGMNGFEVCRQIKDCGATAHIPVIMVTALDQSTDRIAGLEAGADDFLTKPVQDVALFARVRSLVRLKVMMDELRNREATGESLGWDMDSDLTQLFSPDNTSILIIDDSERGARRLAEPLAGYADITHSKGGEGVAEHARERNFDLVIVSLTMQETDGLRIVAKLRGYEETRQVPILAIVDDGDLKLLVRALEMGVNDYLVRPVDRLELSARVKTQLRRKRYADQLWESFHTNMKLASTDAVTGLYNRHYMTSHLETQIRAAHEQHKALSIAILDIDRFKHVNDSFGHAAGDEVLLEFARRIARNIRGVDLAARYGGEEFVVIMPETDIADAQAIAERLRQTVAETPFEISVDGGPLTVTVSIGLAALNSEIVSGQALINMADAALYLAKSSGRNQVVVAGAEPPPQAATA